jgi:2,3-bisphosphoglycerate-dependent phosphoglycerate mutase
VTVKIVFETHSTSLDNERGIATGWRDGALSDEGRRLATELGARHRDPAPSAVFTSDLGRAVETAEIAFGGTGIPILRDRRLRECDYGQMTGMSAARLDDERPRRVDEPFPGGQSYRQVTEQVNHFVQDLVERWEGERLVVIGHAATRFAFDKLLDGVPLEESVVAPFAWQPGWKYLLE